MRRAPDKLLKPGVYSLRSSEGWRGRLAATGVVREYSIPGSSITDKATLFAAVASSLEFPDYFGGNWDALLDCLRDMSWTPADSYVIVVNEADTMRDACPGVADTFRGIVESAIEFHVAHANAMFLILAE